MDKRNSQTVLLKKISDLEVQIAKVFDAGEWGIHHVGSANYKSREEEDMRKINVAMYGEYIE